MAMSRTNLLTELESLTHSARMRRMVEHGKLARGDSAARQVLDELRTGGVYERRLAVQACYGSRDAETVLAALVDPSRLVRSTALKLVPQVCNDEQIRRALELELPHWMPTALVRALARRQRYAPVDAQLSRWLTQGDLRADQLLAFASMEYLRARLPLALEAGLTFHSLARVAQRDPKTMAGLLTRATTSAKESDPRLLNWVSATLPTLSDRVPQLALELVKAWEIRHTLAKLNLDTLARRLPNEVAELVLAHRDRAKLNFASVAHRLDNRHRQALQLHRSAALPLSANWFRRLKAENRTADYRLFQNGWRDAEGKLPSWLLPFLASEDRIREARQHWQNRTLANRQQELASYAAALPWEEALAALQPLLRSPEAERRGAALSALVGTVRFERSRLTELLAILLARQNEQDPVRLVFLQALASLPVAVWQEEHLQALGMVIRQTLDAADVSQGSALTAQTLVLRLLPKHCAWATTWLVTLVRERGQVYLNSLESKLNDEQVRQLAPALLPVMQAWNTRERQLQLLMFAASLGRRLRVFPELLSIVVDIAKHAVGWAAGQALGVIYAHQRQAFGTLVVELLGTDPSWITNHLVYNYLHQRRQDLLTPGFLGRSAYKGKFATGKTRFVLPLVSGFQRWTPTQQAIFAATLAEITHDGVRDLPAKVQAIRQLSALTEVASPRVLELAASTNKELLVRDTALRALARLDGGQGVPILLAALEDDRARIAIYALRQALLEMPAPTALALLQQVSTGKVTVAKEVVRLIGELTSEAAYAELLRWNGQELHRDVRVALVRAFWSHVRREQTWEVLNLAVQSPDAAVAKSVARMPVDGWPESLHHRYAQLLAKLLLHPDAGLRYDVLALLDLRSIVDTHHVMLTSLSACLSSDVIDEMHFAARAILGLYGAQMPSPLGAVTETLLAKRQALDILVQALEELLTAQPGTLRAALDATLSALVHDPLTIEMRVRLAATGLGGLELAEFFEQVAGELHPVALVEGIGIVSRKKNRDSPFTPGDDSPDTTALLELESRLAPSSDERLRRLALAALVAQSEGPLGWSDELRARLELYRADTSTLVAGAAAFTFPPPAPQ